MWKRLIAVAVALAISALAGTASSGVASAAPGDTTSYIFARGLDNAVWSRIRLPNGAWTAWKSLGGSITGTPATTLLPDGALGIFVRGANGAVYTRKTFDSVNWTPWQNLGGSIVGDIVVEGAGWVPNPGQPDLFLVVRGANGVGYLRTLTGSTWSGWRSLGGSFASDFTLDVEEGVRQVYVYGVNNTLTRNGLRRQIDDNGNPLGGWVNIGGSLTDPPTVDGSSSGSPFGIGRAKNLSLVLYFGASGFDTLGGSLGSPPVSGPGGVGGNVLARGTNNVLYGYDFGISSWRNLGGAITGKLGSGLLGDNSVVIAARGTNGSVYFRAANPSNGAWGGWLNLGGQVSGSPALITLIEFEGVTDAQTPGLTEVHAASATTT